MKNLKWSILLTLLSIVSLQAQENVNSKNVFKVHPIDAFGGGIGLGYERVIKPKLSLDFEVFQLFKDISFDDGLSELDYRLFVETDVRRYLSKKRKAPEGFFVGVGILANYNKFNRLKKDESNEVEIDVQELIIGAGIKTGYQWVFKKALKGFTAEANATVDYRIRLKAFDRNTDDGIGVTARVTIGYSW